MSVTDQTATSQEFDHHSQEFVERRFDIFKEIRASDTPVRHTNAHGGYYVVTRYEDVVKAARDAVTFSSDGSGKNVTPFDMSKTGIMIPPSPTQVMCIEMDPPDSAQLRKIIMPFLSRSAVKRFQPRFEHHVDVVIDAFIESGKCDVVEDIARNLPGRLILDLMGMPLEHADRIARTLHMLQYLDPTMPEYQDLVDGHDWIHERIEESLIAHRQAPQEGTIITGLLEAEFAGEPLTDETIVGLVFLVLHGGFDTTHTLLASAIHYIANNPHDRARLTEDRSLIPTAVDEWLRFYSPAVALSRTATTDTELGGTQLHKGDRVLLAWSSANRDEERFSDPDEVILDRFPNPHVALGFGAHRCAGADFAKAETVALINGLLDRISDLTIVEDEVVRFPRLGVTPGFTHMPARFTPGRRVLDQTVN